MKTRPQLWYAHKPGCDQLWIIYPSGHVDTFLSYFPEWVDNYPLTKSQDKSLAQRKRFAREYGYKLIFLGYL